jgi:hypothetical protein
MEKNTLNYLHPLNCMVNIYYVGNDYLRVVNPEILNQYINEIHNNFKKYNDKIFDKATINIWDYLHPDMPKSTKVCDPITQVCTITDMQIAEYAGLTWGWNKRTDLNGAYTSTPHSLANLFSHEIAHSIDYNTEFDNPNDIVGKEWSRIRGVHANSEIPKTELMAEDIRLLHGCSNAKGYERGNYLQANKVKGLYDMLLVWKPISDFIKNNTNYASILKSAQHKYSDTDFNYYGIQLEFEVSVYWWKFSEYYWIDRNAIYKWVSENNVWKWKVFKSF